MRTLATLLLAGALTCVAAQGCGDDPVRERRRALLKPPDAKRQLAERREKLQLFDDKGELLPSGEKVAGVMLPKGLTLYRSDEQQHWFFTGDRIPFEKLDKFFAEQLFSTTVERTAHSVKFGAAQPKDDRKARRIDLYVTRLRGKANATEVYIRAPKPAVFTAREVDEAALRDRRRFAD